MLPNKYVGLKSVLEIGMVLQEKVNSVAWLVTVTKSTNSALRLKIVPTTQPLLIGAKLLYGYIHCKSVMCGQCIVRPTAHVTWSIQFTGCGID